MVPDDALLWLHCLNLTATVLGDALMLKNSQLGQNDGALRITDSIFVQAASLCCQGLLFGLIRVVLHARKNTDTALAVAPHSQLLLFSRIYRMMQEPVIHVGNNVLL